MATFTIIQINGDHINDVDAETLGEAIIMLARNPHAFQSEYGDTSIGRAVQHVGTTGEALRAEELRQYWLHKPRLEMLG